MKFGSSFSFVKSLRYSQPRPQGAFLALEAVRGSTSKALEKRLGDEVALQCVLMLISLF